MRAVVLLVASLFAVTAFAAEDGREKDRISDASLYSSLNIMAVPVGEQGMILKDGQECLWVVRNQGEVLTLVALTGDETGEQLCAKKPE